MNSKTLMTASTTESVHHLQENAIIKQDTYAPTALVDDKQESVLPRTVSRAKSVLFKRLRDSEEEDNDNVSRFSNLDLIDMNDKDSSRVFPPPIVRQRANHGLSVSRRGWHFSRL